MKVIYDECFNRDIKKLRNNTIKDKLIDIISELKKCNNLLDIKHLKKLNSKNNDCYRIGINNFRLGFKLINDEIRLVRILHRKDVYKNFP